MGGGEALLERVSVVSDFFLKIKSKLNLEAVSLVLLFGHIKTVLKVEDLISVCRSYSIIH